MEMAWAQGFREVTVQLDCLVAKNLVCSIDEDGGVNRNLVRRIHHFLGRDWRLTWEHVYREGNHCADFLASFALTVDRGHHVLLEPPEGLQRFLQDDATRVRHVRLCPAVN
ncbi:hypothetical protein QN277_011943 [Acacia crassicarpa]|uniref:RNase H type-1 domain-containing protein n=1 Tax=Acacia crassicarpa TaxID=499986 RepID=A0AAE1N095_9FABA|nr:hypothetical protein QN277_011943 [Acacia crassicarpa]